MSPVLSPPLVPSAPARTGASEADAFFDRLMRGPLRLPVLHDAEAPNQVGPWELRQKMGRGGMSSVYHAVRDTPDGPQHAALKLARRADPQTHAAFEHEAHLLGRFDVPHLVRALDAGVHTDGRPYLAMEPVAGETVTACARARSAHERTRLIRDVCRAVALLHEEGIVHGDLKPEHLVVREDGTVTVLDLGLAIDLTAPPPSSTSLKPSHTPEFAAPEQILGEPVSCATDVYALGLVLHEVLHGRSGRIPWSLGGDLSSTIRTQNMARLKNPAGEPGEALDCALALILWRALQSNPKQRFASAGALALTLTHALDTAAPA